MPDSRSLVVFYSRSGFTRTVAQEIAQAAVADVEELVDRTSRAGLFGYLRSGFDAARKRLTQLAPLAKSPADYDIVIVGTPVWNASVSTPVRTFLTLYKNALPEVAFFCTYGGRGSERAFAQMAGILGRAPRATVAIRDAEMETELAKARLREFIRCSSAVPAAS
jgi:flavodoxin